jgi:hypothetical protein
MAQNAQGDSFWNWLGRQVGHVKKAVKTNVKPAGARQASTAVANPQATADPRGALVPQVIYRDEKAEEVELPDQPGVKLRRTVIDEVIVEEQKKGDSSQ